MFENLLAKVFTIFAQVMVKIQPIWDRFKLLICFVLGIIIGWFLLGWGLFPVSWVNATPGHLREDYRSAYLAYVAEDFFKTGDVNLVRSRLGLDLPKSKNIPWLADPDTLQNDVNTAIERANSSDDVYRISEYLQALDGFNRVLPQIQQEPVDIGDGETEASSNLLQAILPIVGFLVVVVLVLVAVWYLMIGRHRQPQTVEPATSNTMAVPQSYATSVAEGVSMVSEEIPVKSFSTPYVLGDDYFDPSFSIEIGQDFLGECGIGISETLGAGDPKKVTAFEAWLFDKSDIRTITTILASEYAFSDPDLRSKLEPKGDVTLMHPGEVIILETTSLRVVARITELEYAQGSNLPANSFVQKVNFELQAWVKQTPQSSVEAD
jgi:hypothetical protein